MATTAEIVARTRAEQGKPTKVTDPLALAHIAGLLERAKRQGSAA